jgi:hypothetical protein
MKGRSKWLIISLVVIAISLLAVLPAGAARGPWRGPWFNLDLDGSHQVVYFVGQPTAPFVRYTDWGASVCGVDENDEPLYRATLQGSGTLLAGGNSLRFESPIKCWAHPPFNLDFHWSIIFTYNAEMDILFDNYGGEWFRYKPW